MQMDYGFTNISTRMWFTSILDVMAKPTHSDIDSLLRTLVLPFYHIKRDMPLPLGERRWENDAEHS